MGDYKKLCDLLDREIDSEVAKGKLTPDSVHVLGAAIDIVKDIKTIEAMEEEYGGYSGHYPNRGYMPYYAYDAGMDGMSYAPRRRDSMGRYSRDMDNSYRQDYSRESKIDQLQRMMDESKDPNEKESLRRLIVHMENEQR
jgi:hypothetical protein